MAINIFSGSSGGGNAKRTPATSSAAARAEATTKALGSGAVASDSGATAVQSNGIGSKIGKLVGGVSGLLKNVPGPVGMIAGLVNKMSSDNDPEWWETVPGDGMSANDPLQGVETGTVSIEKVGGANTGVNRPCILEFANYSQQLHDQGFDVTTVIEPSDKMIVQYVMPAVRKVANAIYLQDAVHYKTAFKAQVTLYALWRHLKKIDEFLKVGKTYLPSMNVEQFPICQVQNASYLQSTITRLEEYLHSNVRLPHTLCEYLTWRFGRTFKATSSAKSAFIFYSPIAITESIDKYTDYIEQLMTSISADASVQKAATDLYNAYLDHDQEVIVAEEGLPHYDKKEFCLRTNLDLVKGARFFAEGKIGNNILMDSELDNPTVFMASTISSQVKQNELALFPVVAAYVYQYRKPLDGSEVNVNSVYFGPALVQVDGGGNKLVIATRRSIERSFKVLNASPWQRLEIRPGLLCMYNNEQMPQTANEWAMVGDDYAAGIMAFLAQIEMCKHLDYYNVGLYLPYGYYGSPVGQVDQPLPTLGEAFDCVDMTTLCQDSGIVADTVIINEQVLAFANLVTEVHKNKTTYRQIERRVAKDVANTIESIPVASVATK